VNRRQRVAPGHEVFGVGMDLRLHRERRVALSRPLADEHEFLALAKHYTNATVDLSFAWIASPLATTRFLTDAIVTFPSSKLMIFGGDHRIIELAVGHAHMARRGLGTALSRLVDDGWLAMDEALTMVPQLMHENAAHLLPHTPVSARTMDT
jgi:hypothetical protein